MFLATHTQGMSTPLLFKALLSLVPKVVRRGGLSAGEAYHIPRGLAHETRNGGDPLARLVHVFVVDKGKQLVQPVAK